MALEFFRRRQKLVFVIMVALMVSFLIGGYGLSHVVGRSGGAQTIGMTRLGKITVQDVMRADVERIILDAINRQTPGQDAEYVALLANGGQSAMAYALLLKEARSSSIDVPDEDVDAFLAVRQLDGARLQTMLYSLKGSLPDISMPMIRAATADWVRVKKLFLRSLFYVQFQGMPVGTAASEPELRHLYRDLTEKIDLRIAVLDANDFLDGVAEPTEEEIDKQFQEFRERQAGVDSNDNPFGFGYRQDDRASLLYLLVRQDVVDRVVRPSDKEVRDYYRLHAQDFVKKAASTSQPSSSAGGPATQASQPAEPMTFAEAKGQIIELLKAPAVRDALNAAVAQIRSLMDEYGQEDRGGIDPYHWALSKMTVSAEPVLRREIDTLDMHAQPLDAAIATLAEKAQLEAIAFPWGKQGDLNLDPNVKVSLKADKTTLGEALDEICRQVKLPKLHWATCPAFKDAIFSVANAGGIDFFPIQVAQTGLMDAAEMLNDKVLGECYTSAESPLADIVFAAQPFGRAGSGGMKEGDDGPRMVVVGPRAGRLLWRLVQAKPQHAPLTRDEVPGLVDKIKTDLRTRAAFNLAAEKAGKLNEQAAQKGLAAAAKGVDLKTAQTGLFTRRFEILPQQRYEILAKLTGRGLSLIRQAMLPPFDYPLSDVPGLELPSSPTRQAFMDAAFALAPENVEPPYPQSSPATGVVQLPFTRQAVVMERIGYQPAVISQYLRAKPLLAVKLEFNTIWRHRMLWFNINAVMMRMDCRLASGPAARQAPMPYEEPEL